MKSALDSLRGEHLVLRDALAVLGAMAEHVRRGDAFPGPDCARLLRFLRDFVLGVHFRKEAEQVLPALAVHGGDREVELAGSMLACQEEVGTLLHGLILFWEPVGELTPAERQVFVETACVFQSRMLEMLDTEDRELLPAAEHRVPTDDRLGWSPAFQAIEAGRRGLAPWRAEIADLRTRWH